MTKSATPDRPSGPVITSELLPKLDKDEVHIFENIEFFILQLPIPARHCCRIIEKIDVRKFCALDKTRDSTGDMISACVPKCPLTRVRVHPKDKDLAMQLKNFGDARLVSEPASAGPSMQEDSMEVSDSLYKWLNSDSAEYLMNVMNGSVVEAPIQFDDVNLNMDLEMRAAAAGSNPTTMARALQGGAPALLPTESIEFDFYPSDIRCINMVKDALKQPFFRPMREGGVIQFEIWIVAFPIPGLKIDVGRILALLDSEKVHEFVRSEVGEERISTDFKEIMFHDMLEKRKSEGRKK
ncbi:hypothetical protein BGW38_009804 [Lunasporangiospora selenospora]|uniref:Uncharacterized protein n=1 Tax=Lunasporangiospora selenospora TaxID=979761 RepID=A0A9P6KFT3_9FUNG|nr:hypothetical protein BGW38_009804 [Lunasporangiospora selenospora]